jgi:hypothetical protein
MTKPLTIDLSLNRPQNQAAVWRLLNGIDITLENVERLTLI